MIEPTTTSEERRLQHAQRPRTPWTRWRPYRAGVGAISDDQQRLCFAVGLRNVYGDDLEPSDSYLDSTPTHSYMRCLARYGPRLLDVLVEYAKAAPEDILVRVTVGNLSPGQMSLHVRPRLWLRDRGEPWLCGVQGPDGMPAVEASHPTLGDRYLYYDGDPDVVYTHGAQDLATAVADYRLRVAGRQAVEIRLRLTIAPPEARNGGMLGDDFERIFAIRQREAAEYAGAGAFAPRRSAAPITTPRRADAA
jgi:hypothetical protein